MRSMKHGEEPSVPLQEETTVSLSKVCVSRSVRELTSGARRVYLRIQQ